MTLSKINQSTNIDISVGSSHTILSQKLNLLFLANQNYPAQIQQHTRVQFPIEILKRDQNPYSFLGQNESGDETQLYQYDKAQ